MSKKARSAGTQKREKEKEKDLQKADRRRALERERADAQRKKTVALMRSGKLKLKKAKPEEELYSMMPSVPNQSAIRREDVVIDKNTDSRKEPNHYKLEGDTGW
ncbi:MULTISPECIES: hypothetical protein [Pseudomonas]|uniref:Nucleoprotein/polynucleotide-associated enzyme n=1 Tax=Pseudomonas putida S13.1.2 TaxID=1384061 RepID=A0AAU8RV59_PSEPU|nr:MULTISPECIES: hypothetical protein [Pseudomonas]AJQ46899.1 hypothetical protein N805_06515 [Pseudomonas putida S13.1.2]